MLLYHTDIALEDKVKLSVTFLLTHNIYIFLSISYSAMEDRDIIPPPPSVDVRNPAGGLLNRYDNTSLQVKVLCVGMYASGKSTFLNRWQTNLKTKTRTTINLDFYEKHVDGYFPIMLQPTPDPVVLDDCSGPPHSWTKVEFPSTTTAKGSAVTNQYLITQSNFDRVPSDSDFDSTIGSIGRQPSTLGARGSNSHSNTYATPAPASSSSNTTADYSQEGIANKNYRNPRYTDSVPNISKALMRAAEVAKKARATVNAEPTPDRFDVLQRATQKRPISEVDGVQVLSIYSLTRELGSLSGSGRFTTELYGLTQSLGDIKRTVRDPRQVAACQMNTNFGYSYYERRPLHVQCWDIQGQEHSRNMTRTYYADAFAALVFVDITRPASLADAVLWRGDIISKVFVKTASDASIEGKGGPSKASAIPPSRHGKGGRPANSGNTKEGSPGTSHGDAEEECPIPCWLVLNKCDLLDPKTHQFPSREAWQAQTSEYRDLDDFCARTGFVGWSLASGTRDINVNGTMERVIQMCCNQFPREIYRHSTKGKQPFLQPKQKPKQKKECCKFN